MFPTFLGWIFSMISGFQCSPVAWLEVFIPSPFKWSLSSMHLWFSWRFLVFSPHGGHQVNGNTTSSVIYHLKHLVHPGRLMAGTYTHHPWKERKMIWTIHLHEDMFQPLIFRGVMRLSKTQFIVFRLFVMVSLPSSLNQTAYNSHSSWSLSKNESFFGICHPWKTLQSFCWRRSIAGYFDWLRHGWTLWQRQRSKSLEPWQYRWWKKSGVHQSGQLRLVGKNTLFTTGFIHRRWLALGFRNHQQYSFETYEPKKKNVEPKTVGFLETHRFDLGKTDSLLKNIIGRF